MAATFEETLAFGMVAEKQVEAWLGLVCDYHVLSVYESTSEGKGPRLRLASGKELVVPDLFAIRGTDTRWIEVKHKNSFTWYRKQMCWTTGIDIPYYQHYLDVSKQTPFPVYLMFLHEQAEVEGRQAPTGLYAGELVYLSQNENHRSDKWGKGGMVYWRESVLRQIATISDVRKAAQVSQRERRTVTP